MLALQDEMPILMLMAAWMSAELTVASPVRARVRGRRRAGTGTVTTRAAGAVWLRLPLLPVIDRGSWPPVLNSGSDCQSRGSRRRDGTRIETGRRAVGNPAALKPTLPVKPPEGVTQSIGCVRSRVTV